MAAAGNPFEKGGAFAHLIDAVIQGNSWQAREPALKLYSKIVNNILQNPLEPKFRKLSVEKVIGKFGADFKGIAELLKHVGFVPQDVNLVFPEAALTAPLEQSLAAWLSREAHMATLRAEAEARLAENKREIDAMKAAKEANRAQVKSLSKDARANVASKPVVASTGNALKFGSTVVKTAPPPPPANKGG